MLLNDKTPEYWNLLASHDIDTVKILLKQRGHPEIIIYHMHQAVEKLLKGQIIKVGVIFPYIHNIERLYKILVEKDISLQGLEKEIILLQSYFIETRYPQADLLNKKDLKKAKSIFDIIITKLEKK